MLAVWSWLLELVDIDRDVDPDEGARALTAAGLEVESVEQIGGGFSGVVIAEVVAKRKHPHADKLSLVDLIDADGGSATQVVCGAPNVPEPGGRVLWAKPGSVLPGGFEISTRAIKGVDSPGMICSEKELGLGEDHEGIIVLGDREGDIRLGQDAAAALRLRDVVFEIGAPANRPDTLGHLGLARELAALLGGRFRGIDPDISALTDSGVSAADRVTVQIDDPIGCPRYTARVIDGVSVAPSPQWLKQRLRAVGVRPISNLVDITNYVMFETGQPLHGFDYDKVGGAKILVRRASEGEKMKTLDEQERALTAQDLLICDGAGPVALAGVMGGLESEVSDATRSVLLESASFEPVMVRRTAKRLGLHSESSHRFERHVDPNGAELASRRAAQLMAELGGGTIAAGLVDAYPTVSEPRVVSIRPSRATALTGVELDAERIQGLFESLGLDARRAGDDKVDVTCPTSRPDLAREVDLIEETIRLHGFDKVHGTLPRSSVPPTRTPDRRALLARRALVGIGMSEAITFGFTSPDRVASLRLPADDRRANPLALKNPMTLEQSVMRTSLVPNLLGAVARNIKYDVPDVRLFEIGSVFLANGEGELPDEPVHIAGVLCGTRPGWLVPGDRIDFFDLKGVVDRLLAALLGAAAPGVSYSPTAGDISYLHPNISARIALGDGTEIGVLGEVHPETRAVFDIEVPVFAFDVTLAQIPALTAAQMTEIPNYPAITRDVSFFVSEEIPAARVAALIGSERAPLVERFDVLEEYKDAEKVPEGQKGMLWSIVYRAGDRTLTDAEVDEVHEGIVAKLLETLPAQRR